MKEKKKNLWWFLGQVVERISNIILGMLKLSFLTWGLITYLWMTSKIQLNGIDYILFTLGIIGVKTWKKTKEHMEIMKGKGGF